MQNTNAAGNVGIGNLACRGAGSGIGANDGATNIAIGNCSLENLISGNSNICIGSISGNTISTGSGNICIGEEAGHTILVGNSNICIGQKNWRTDYGEWHWRL